MIRMQMRYAKKSAKVGTSHGISGQRRMFFDKIKAAAKAFAADPTNSIAENSVKQSTRTPHAGASLEETLGSKEKWSLRGSIINFALRKLDKIAQKNMNEMNDILFSASQMLENNSSVVGMLGPFIKISNPNPLGAATGGNGSISAQSTKINGKMTTIYQITAAVSSSGGSSSSSSSSSSDGIVYITANAKEGEIDIQSLQLHGAGGEVVDVMAGGSSRGKRRVGKVTTIDVKAK